MTQDEMKRAAAEAALEHVPRGAVIGVGTGSTTDHFVDALAASGIAVEGAIASSQATADLLSGHGIRLVELNDVDGLGVYVDGTDAADDRLRLVKGGGGAHTREKIVASASERFVCIADETKLVALDSVALPLEVVPMAREAVARRVAERGGRAIWRGGFTTDNGNAILDVQGLELATPEEMEAWLNAIPGVVDNGLFALRPADILLVGGTEGVRSFSRE
jgi:ribose 5-phosphate isomerase A